MVDILCEPKIVNIKNEVLCYSIKIQKTCFKPFLLIFHLFLVCIFFLLSNFNEYLQRRLFFVEADSVFFCYTYRDSPTRFSNSSCFLHSNQPGPLTYGLKYFQFWLSFRWDILILLNLPWVWYCAEYISPGYHTPASHFSRSYLKGQSNEIFDMFFS